MQEGGPVLSAATGNQSPPSDLDAMVKNYVAAEIEDTEDMTMTSAELSEAVPTQTSTEWDGPQGEQYRPVLLGHSTRRGFAVTGLAVMCLHGDRPFRFPGRAVSLISDALLDAGDVVTIFAAE